MSKIEITDDMINRACLAAYGEAFPSTLGKTMRVALNAALNSPPEPEIAVTEEMLAAGHVAHNTSHGFNPKAKSWERSTTQDAANAAVYRAMRKLEPKEPINKVEQRSGKDRRVGYDCDNSEVRRLLGFGRRVGDTTDYTSLPKYNSCGATSRKPQSGDTQQNG